ncbi:MAG: hypothetical protein DI565_03965 [Ancylobacter novellus]|uniref:Uncharacterized protein n=1 Tax=Ancylobacter novellus TaxID=921 RepID=A0A2W5KLE0_ANCNO|nr:MAG: hypothetical protein DI565_03965 [Ancylobacter novellus]
MILGLTCLVGVASHSTAAQAQASRTWVSGVGDDANPCSRTAPCKTFAGALPKTLAGGVINALDPASFGAVSINKAITIRAVGQEAGVSGGIGFPSITVNAPGAQVNLIGLSIDGLGIAGTGVQVTAANQVLIKDCEILNHRGGDGFGVRLSNGLETRVTIQDTTISGNLIGVEVAATTALTNVVVMENVLLDANTTANIRAARSASRVIMRRSTSIAGPIRIQNGAELRSFGDNAINGTPTLTIPLQ